MAVSSGDQHAARAWDQRLYNEGIGLFRSAAGTLQRVERRLLAAFGGKGDGAHVDQQRRISAIVYAAFADGHRAYGVAMIAMFQHQTAVTRLPAIVPLAKRHLQRHFPAGPTAVGKENAGEASKEKRR